MAPLRKISYIKMWTLNLAVTVGVQTKRVPEFWL